MNQSIYLKYSQNQNINSSFDEILRDFSQIKPTFNPILDICTIKIRGGYIYNVTNFQKWKICPNLLDEIINTSQDIDYNMKIEDIIKKAISKYKDPSYTINEIFYFFSDKIKNNINDSMNDSINISKYFEMKTDYNNFLNQIKLKYQDEWSDIEKKYDIISNTLIKNFNELENDCNFETTIELIESISKKVNCKIEQLIDCYSILIKNSNSENILSSQIKIDFDKKMDEIYEQEILLHFNNNLIFDKLIRDAILDMYGVEKEIHRMSLTLENCSHILKKINVN